MCLVPPPSLITAQSEEEQSSVKSCKMLLFGSFQPDFWDLLSKFIVNAQFGCIIPHLVT